MHATNEYNGDQVVIHTVRKGENLSVIAQRYRFKSWMPIWVYNTQMHRVLGESPDELQVGMKLLIPRSKRGYDHLVKKLKALQMGMQYFGDREIYSLEAAYYRHKADRVVLNFLADALTTIATAGFKARRASEMYSAAQQMAGQERVAGEYLARKASEEASKDINRNFVKKVVDLLKERASSGWSEKNKEKLDTAYKASTETAPKVLKAIRGFSMQGGKALLDISEMILDWLEPSTVADWWLMYVSGVGNPEKAYEANRDQIEKAVGNSCKHLHDKIVQLERERDTVYSAR